MARKRARSERIEVYCPRGLKGEVLAIVGPGTDNGSVSAWVVSLIRAAVNDQKKFSHR